MTNDDHAPGDINVRGSIIGMGIAVALRATCDGPPDHTYYAAYVEAEVPPEAG